MLLIGFDGAEFGARDDGMMKKQRIGLRLASRIKHEKRRNTPVRRRITISLILASPVCAALASVCVCVLNANPICRMR